MHIFFTYFIHFFYISLALIVLEHHLWKTRKWLKNKLSEGYLHYNDFIFVCHIYYHITATTVHYSKIFIRVTLLEFSLENKAISNPICNLIVMLGLSSFLQHFLLNTNNRILLFIFNDIYYNTNYINRMWFYWVLSWSCLLSELWFNEKLKNNDGM